MSYREDDLGEFNDSTVFLQPANFNPKALPTLAKHNNPERVNLGIYDSIKLSPYIENRAGELLEFINLDPYSHNTFVTTEALNLLERYSTDELCFVMVVGNRGAGKSFFCDKILNLSEVRGNHFCRKKNKGINIWSTPFVKDDLKIFFLEISNCDINSQEFKILSTYALMIGSAFITVQTLKNNGKSPIEELDEVIADVADKLTPSRIEGGERVRSNSDIFLPKIFYNLQRSSGRTNIQGLSKIQFYANEVLPDALQRSYRGPAEDLLQLPFLDTKCINQDYIRRAATIFSDLYSKLSQKRYKQLTLNGNIIAKIIRQIQAYLNSNKTLNIQDVYIKVINDLYQSAYNYCILGYHEEMTRQFQDEKPKSFEDLLLLFEKISDITLDKFQQFNLDEKLYGQYYEKLQSHISQKQQMIMDINAKKTQQIIFQSYDENQIGNIKYYRSFVDRMDKQYKELTHGKANIVAKINSKFYQNSNNSNSVQFQSMKAIQQLKENIDRQNKQYQKIYKINQEKNIARSKDNKEQEGLLSAEHALKTKINTLNRQITRVSNAQLIDPSHQKEEERTLNQRIAINTKVLEQLKGTPQKDQRVANLEKKIEEVMAKCVLQERLLKQLQESGNNPTESVVKQSRKPRQGSKKVIK